MAPTSASVVGPGQTHPNVAKSRNRGCCSVQLVKNFSHVFNIIFFGGGCCALGVGIWTMAVRHEYLVLLTNITYPLTTYILSGAGALTLIVSLIGCCSVHRENRCCLLLYIFLLLLIFLLEAMVGVIAYVYREQIQSELEYNLNETFTHNYMVHARHTAAIDSLQQEYKCCGASSFENWSNSEWLKMSNTTNLVPDSCCKTVSPGCGRSSHPSNIPYTGCVHSLTDSLHHQLFIVCVVALSICVLPVFGIVLSCCVYIKLRNYAYRGY